jgi:hypothetical protein
LEAVGVAFDDAQRAATDGAGGTEDGDALHGDEGATILRDLGLFGATLAGEVG